VEARAEWEGHRARVVSFPRQRRRRAGRLVSNGKSVLETVRKEGSSTYLRVLFSLVPKDVALSIQHKDGLYDPEDRVRCLIDVIEASGAAMGVSLERESLEQVFSCIEDDLCARSADYKVGPIGRNGGSNAGEGRAYEVCS
jgi:hypothetical protein